MPILSVDEHQTIIRRVLLSRGVTEPSADIQAHHLLEGDLRGHPSHGIQRLPVLARRLDNGLINPEAQPTLTSHSWCAATVDGDAGLGPVVAFEALEGLTTQAHKHAVAVVGLRNCSHLGMLAPYVEALARRGLIAIALTISEALVHPVGARSAMLGTNPLAIAVPTESEPLVLDMATSAISMGEVLQRQATGQPLDPNTAVDSDGRMTTDPTAALTGALSPFGGYKGFALGLAIELIVPLLTGSEIGTAVTGTLDTTDPCNKGDLFIAFDPEKFGAGRVPVVSQYLNDVAQAMQSGEGTLLPGERSRRLSARQQAEGITVAVDTWNQIRTLMPERAEDTHA